MPVNWLFTWWNAVYTLPLAFVLVLLAVTALMSLVGGAFGEVDADHDADVHHDLGADHDADLDHDLEVDHDADLDHDGDVDAVDRAIAVTRGMASAEEHGALVSGLALIGVGHAPLLMVVQVLLLLWGLVGIALHQAARVTGPGALLWSVPVTLLVSVLGTLSFAGVFGRLFKPYESSALKRGQIVGRTGRVVFTVMTGGGGS